MSVYVYCMALIRLLRNNPISSITHKADNDATIHCHNIQSGAIVSNSIDLPQGRQLGTRNSVPEHKPE